MTGIERAAKFFYPHRNTRNKTIKFYAKKLHKLRTCPALIQYATQETTWIEGQKVHYLISEFVEGETFDEFMNHPGGKRLDPFQAIHLLYALITRLDSIHQMNEYHGDLHGENIIISRRGLGFEIKLIDIFHWGAASPENIRGDICDAIRIFYDAIGGAKYYSKQPRLVKEICCGLKRSLILKKFRTSSALKAHLENLDWESFDE